MRLRRAVSSFLVFVMTCGLFSASAQQAPTASAQSTSSEQTNPMPTSATTAKPGAPVLLDGTPIKLRVGRTLSSADAKVGDSVDFEVLEEVKVANVVVIPKGGTAIATVTQAQPKKRMGRGGKLDVNIDYVRLVDGNKVALRAIKETKGGGHVGAMTGAMVATGIVFFPAAPLFLFMHGKDITIPKGTEITAYVNGDVQIDLAKMQQPVADPSAVAAKAPETSGKVQITSQPSGADIEVDGSFVGNSPSTLSLTAGEHVITIKKGGYKDWERKIKISTGDVTLNPELEKLQQAVEQK